MRKNIFGKICVVAVFAVFAAVIFVSCKTGYSLYSLDVNNRKSVDSASFVHHAETLKKANAQNVSGDFERENRFEYRGVAAEMSRENDDYFIKFERGGNAEIYKIAAVVGGKRVEEYVAEKDGALVRLPIGYDLQTRRWMNLDEAYFEPDGKDFFAHQKNWRTDCAVCHLEKTDDAAKTLRTANFLTADLNRHSDASLLTCGQCHAKDLTDSMPNFERIQKANFDAAKVISAHRKSTQPESHFYSDGSIRLAAHEYQGIIRSVCYLQSKADGTKIGGEKINCANCHTAQNGDFDVAKDEKLHTNQICTTCHQQFADATNLTEHTKHRADSAAANCVSCHQPEIVYGNLKFQRTHEISVPNPELTANKQVPNACNVCHTDQSVNWAIQETKNLWTERFRDAKISTDSQFDVPEGIRGLFAGDAFVRALSAHNLTVHADDDWARPFLVEAVNDENYPLVKYFLARSLMRKNSPTADAFAPENQTSSAEIKRISRRLRCLRRFPDIEIGE